MFDEHTLTDLDEDIEKLKAFNETITALKERGQGLGIENFDEFFGEMKNLSIEDADILAKLLLSQEDEGFVEYFKDYGEKKSLTEQIAKELYKDDYTLAAQSVKTAVESEFENIPEEFFKYGELTAENFKSGFQTEILGLFEGVSELLYEGGLSFGSLLGREFAGNTYSATYNLFGSGETVSEQLISAQNHAALNKLRGE